ELATTLAGEIAAEERARDTAPVATVDFGADLRRHPIGDWRDPAGDGEPSHSVARAPDRSVQLHGALPQHQWLRTSCGDANVPAGDRRRGEQRWRALAGLRVQVETGRRSPGAGFRGAAPAQAGLANVVRGTGDLRGKPVVHGIPEPAAGGLTARARPVGAQSVSRGPAALCARRGLRLPFYGPGHTPVRRRVVAQRIQ